MSKYRVYELAKEFETTSKVILEVLTRNHKDTAKNHMSSVGDEERDIIKRVFSPEKARQAQESAPRTAAAPVNRSNPQARPQERPQGFQQGNRPAGQQSSRQGGQQQGNRPAGQQNSRQGGQQQGNRPVGQQGNQPGGQQGNRPAGQQGNRPAGQQGNRPAGQQGNRPAGQQGNRPGGQQGNRPAGQQGNRPGGQQGNRPGGQQGNRPGGQQGNRPGGQQGNRPGGHQSNRPAGQQGNRPGGQQGNRPGGQQGNRPGGQQGTRPGGQQGNRPAGQGNRSGQGNRQGQQGGARLGSLARRSPATRSKAAAKNRRNQAAVQKVVKRDVERPEMIKLGDSVVVKDFAAMIGSEVSEIIKKLMMLGTMVTINQEIDFDTASLIAEDFGVAVEALPPEEDPTEIPVIVDDPSTLVARPPVVTVMGHVDHGKTSLLDAIRKTRVQAREAGGITQHIGAYQVVCNDKPIVFLDTPGHEAFTAMRARGAQVTDIAILVVAADDGVMPQTVEAINHAKAAGVPILVAINKIDREGANPDHVKQQLSEYGLIPEDWGGETIMAPVSAKKQTGIDELLEMVLLVAEMQELKANPNRQAQGIIIEAQLDKGRGPVATVLVQSGTLQVGDSIIAGVAHGKVRAMINDRGEKVKKAGPSTPVEVLGLTDVPEAGDMLAVLDEKTVRAIADKRIAKRRSEEMKQKQKVSLDDLFQQIQDGNIKDLNILIKADVQGSVEALRSSLLALNDGEKNKEVRVNVIHAGAGAVNESDVMLASAANALILAFNVRPDANARKLAEAEAIDVRTYRVIYEAIGDVEAAMTGMLAPKYQEVVQGKAEIRQVMSFSKALVAGSYVLEGKVTNSSQIRLIRDGSVVYEGVIESLRRFKDDVKEVASGFECGITIDKYRDIKEGDIIEAFTMEQIKPGAAASE